MLLRLLDQVLFEESASLVLCELLECYGITEWLTGHASVFVTYILLNAKKWERGNTEKYIYQFFSFV